LASASVVIATHSRPHTLPRSVESAQGSGSDVEVIVVDDASTDSTAEVCRSLRNIRYVRLDKNLGVAGARNRGVLESSTPYVTFLDDDDVRLPGSLDMQVKALMGAAEAGFAYGQVYLGDSDCSPTGDIDPQDCPEGDVFWKLLEWNFIHCVSGVVRRSCFIDAGMFDPALPGLDWDLWVRLAHDFHAVAVKHPVAVYRVPSPTSDQDSSRIARIMLEAARAHQRWLNMPKAIQAPAIQRERARRLFLNRASDSLIFTASAGLEAGVKRTARENLLAALRLNPRRAVRPWSMKLLASSLR
jgi:glycosyltransferase involved in cell wall biosynthesis